MPFASPAKLVLFPGWCVVRSSSTWWPPGEILLEMCDLGGGYRDSHHLSGRPDQLDDHQRHGGPLPGLSRPGKSLSRPWERPFRGYFKWP